MNTEFLFWEIPRPPEADTPFEKLVYAHNLVGKN